MPDQETIEKNSTTHKQKFYKEILDLRFKLKKAPGNIHFKNSVYKDGGELVESCVAEFREDCKILKEAIEEYIKSEEKSGTSLKNRITEKLNLGLKLDQNKMKEIAECLEKYSKKPEEQCDEIYVTVLNFRKSIKPYSAINKNIIKKLANIEKRLTKAGDMMTQDFLERHPMGNLAMPMEEFEKKAKTRKKEFFNKIKNLDFSYDPNKSKSIIDSNTGEVEDDTVEDYRESCKKLAAAIHRYVELEEKDEKSTKFKAKSLLGLKLNLTKMKNLKKELLSNGIKSDNGQDLTRTCLDIKPKMTDFRKSIVTTSPINKEIRKKLASFEKQLRTNMEIWNKDPYFPDNLKKRKK